MRKTIRGLRQPCLGDALSENNMPISNTLTYNDTYANGLSWYMLTTILVVIVAGARFGSCRWPVILLLGFFIITGFRMI